MSTYTSDEFEKIPAQKDKLEILSSTNLGARIMRIKSSIVPESDMSEDITEALGRDRRYLNGR
jgi:hypothetical protein